MEGEKSIGHVWVAYGKVLVGTRWAISLFPV